MHTPPSEQPHIEHATAWAFASPHGIGRPSMQANVLVCPVQGGEHVPAVQKPGEGQSLSEPQPCEQILPAELDRHASPSTHTSDEHGDKYPVRERHTWLEDAQYSSASQSLLLRQPAETPVSDAPPDDDSPLQ
jgi:hypothetical protein